MEIKVRDISKEAVIKIDGLAKKKGLSRNEYLKRHLENLSIMDKINDNEAKYTILIEKITKILDYNTLALNKFLEENLFTLDELVQENSLKG
ncbi:hypothetical protein FDB15_18275 [Clostridium botulinum]|uniref:Uncharacterized protein n=1 Tax=Clostridium botulinum TaxID=1491 RepID=A0A0A0V067_CLOBO|nr:hypothetical protein [Clostridium botulinum]AIW54802.1 hypothetical protein [Clostridium botulinum]MBY7043788.1 hypothetical protein [Clostridium botulinum]NFI02370.1 hypothetical protein [Clostridium botulinum]NFI64772.1 hypothetical protein [Clostridium botulinum]NFJ45638.1 hypothetical protein [Clostridium botulinum]